MLSIKVKMLDEDMKVRLLIECETHYIFKNYKSYVDCNIENKNRNIEKLQAKAYHYFSELETGLKDIIKNKKYSVKRDIELNVDIVKVEISKELEKYFNAESLANLRYETSEFSNNVKESDVLSMLEYNLKNVSDFVDILT